MSSTLTRQNADVDTPSTDARSPEAATTRRRRWMLPVAIIVALTLVAATAFTIVGNIRAENQARADAAAAAAETDLTAAFATYRTTLATPTQDARAAAGQVRLAMLDLLRASDRPEGEVFAAAGSNIAAMRRGAEGLAEAATQPLPEIPSELAERDLSPLTQRLQLAREDAFALADELSTAADDAEAWVLALRDVRDAAATFAETAEQSPSSSTPSGLIAQYEAQRPVLDGYQTAADALAEFPGMAPLADAHRDYVAANRQWIDEAVGLLGADDRRTYNARLDQVFGDDPFGFDAALAEATPRAIGSQTITDVETAQRRAIAYAEQLEDLRRDLPDLLAGETPPAELSGQREDG